MPTQVNISDRYTDSHPIWRGKGYVIRALGKITYHGKHTDPHSTPNRLIEFQPNMNSLLGDGSYGTVYKATAFTINYDLKQIERKEKQKVIKIICDVDQRKKQLILAEYQQGKKTFHLGMKAPVFEGPEGQEICYLVMNRQPGENLESLYNQGTIAKLSTVQKLELSYKLLLALRDQVTYHGIVHRDIKPANIMVQLEPEITVKIIDYGLAKEQGTDDNKYAGTPQFTAPEVFKREKADTPCDVFSMGRVIALFWSKNDDFYHPPPKLYLYFAQKSHIDIGFNQSDELSEHPEMLSLLTQMLSPKPENRITIYRAIEQIEKAYCHNKNVVDKNISMIHASLYQLSNYAKKIKHSHPNDYLITTQFVQDIRKILSSKENRIDEIKHDCLQKLNEEGIQSCAKNHKRTAFLLKNIAAAVAGLGLFYGIAFGINKLITGRNGFFHNEISKAHHQMKHELELLSNP